MSSSNLSHSVAMDVDGPSSGPGTLKRCSSAPMINETTNVMSTANSPTSNRDQQPFIFGSASQMRPRRFSASFSQVPGSPILGPRLTPRINQLRQEEHEVTSNTRELAHEREIHHTMQISQSWEDLSLMSDSNESTKNNNRMGPLQLNLPICGSGFICNSPSPTRSGFQSPTRSRTIIRRSASPVLRPSPLGVKRKLDDDKTDFHLSPRAKRVYSYSGGADRVGLLTTTGTSLPGSLSSVGTPESVSSADSPSFNNFRNVDSPSPGRAMPLDSMSISKNDQEMTESPS
ncbi:PPP2R1A-PPP2R2A-interacting phosphatase regulator 1 [Diorhabda carinulata]|uniref:PPP2R1A-PPP2R2A-interacting phosphatase regulator 1 n=1 Tax=Diorhabda sublineata TaxID=1163346 RepID=UPI0024E0F88A|nr:PPP2R1A-PPP2R2A-interacting phosphatase regulator 1 [Diorhabda sublineata]XP_057670857.1 PPP2R1A-PPP2R2A-interacting phosphatase regulator 1 [Diorhabda carinulata]